MKDEYIIVNKTDILKRIEELEKYNERFKHAKTRSPYGLPVNPTVAAWEATLSTLKQLLSQSTPLIPEIDKAYTAGMEFIGEDKGSPNEYLSNLKLDI